MLYCQWPGQGKTAAAAPPATAPFGLERLARAPIGGGGPALD